MTPIGEYYAILWGPDDEDPALVGQPVRRPDNAELSLLGDELIAWRLSIHAALETREYEG